MFYTLEDVNGVQIDVDLSSTDTMNLIVSGCQVELDAMDVGVVVGLLMSWLARGGFPR